MSTPLFNQMKPSTDQLSCILNHLAESNSPIVWEKISIKLSSGSEKKPDTYWKSLFDAAKARTLLKVQLLKSLQNNRIEITDDLRLTEIENRILQHDQTISTYGYDNDGDDQCRICLEHGNGFFNFFNEPQQTPSTIDKLMECSRISPVGFLNAIVWSLD